MNFIQSVLEFFRRLFATGQSQSQANASTVAARPAPPRRETPPPPKPPEAESPAAAPPVAASEPATSPPKAEPLAPLPVKLSEAVERGKTILYVSGGDLKARFIPVKRGHYSTGDCKAVDFIASEPPELKKVNLSDSAVNVMRPVSDNEGNLDAINTWDNSFLSFGMFQWTLGAGNNKGELAALLKKVKDNYPRVFEKYFGIYGLDVADDTNAVYGNLSLGGKVLSNTTDKEALRNPEWAFRFWHAGQDPAVQATEIEHAISRLKTFYWKRSQGVNDVPLAEIITSQYGVALILDNHVNRPGYVRRCVNEAAQRTGIAKPRSTEEEQRLLDAYVDIRRTYGSSPMTHAEKRAAVTRKYVDDGLLSLERASFVFDPGVGSRGMDPDALIGLKPEDYREWEFENIRDYDEEPREEL